MSEFYFLEDYWVCTPNRTSPVIHPKQHSRQVMDATAMTFENDSFELAVDKGTLDAMMSPGTNEFAGATWISVC